LHLAAVARRQYLNLGFVTVDYSSEATHSAFGAESTFGTCLAPPATASYSAVTGWYFLLHFVQ
jgi:hypothetical protein